MRFIDKRNEHKLEKGMIITEVPVTAEICDEIFKNTFVNEYHLVLNIESLLLRVTNILNTKELNEDKKEQLGKVKKLLINLKEVYTEKKTIILKAKDNDTLLFILDYFKKHQANKQIKKKIIIK